jgi:hypothetical protein
MIKSVQVDSSRFCGCHAAVRMVDRKKMINCKERESTAKWDDRPRARRSIATPMINREGLGQSQEGRPSQWRMIGCKRTTKSLRRMINRKTQD